MMHDTITYRDGKEILVQDASGAATLWLEPDPEDAQLRLACDADYWHDNHCGIRIAPDIAPEALAEAWLTRGDLEDAVVAVTDRLGYSQTEACRAALQALRAAMRNLDLCPTADDLHYDCVRLRREMLKLRDKSRRDWNDNLHLQAGRAHIGAEEVE